MVLSLEAIGPITTLWSFSVCYKKVMNCYIVYYNHFDLVYTRKRNSNIDVFKITFIVFWDHTKIIGLIIGLHSVLLGYITFANII